MYAFIHSVEAVLAPLFAGFPDLPKHVKELLASFWPALALIGGILQIIAFVVLWQAGRTADNLIQVSNYGYNTATHELGLTYWLSLVALLVDAVILLVAAGKLMARTKKGWDLLFLATFLNAAYSLIALFDSYGGVGSFVGSLLWSVVSFYLLFQTRGLYLGIKLPREATKNKK